jgi:four helix bundle protein
MSLAHEKLIVWQRADDLFITVHRITRQCFPNDERFALGTQIRRSAYSIPANIVEGNTRESDREKLRFFNIASASLNETGYGIHAAHRLGYLSDDTYSDLHALLGAVGAPLHGLIRQRRNRLATKIGISSGVFLVATLRIAQWLL